MGVIAPLLMGARLAGFTNEQVLRVGVGTVSRGEVGLIVASIGVREHITGREAFSMVVGLVFDHAHRAAVAARRISVNGWPSNGVIYQEA